MHRRPRRLVAVGVAAALVLAGCASKKEKEATDGGLDDGTEATATTAAPEPEEATADAEQFPDTPVGVTDDEILVGIHAPETLAGVDIGNILGLRKLSEAFWRSTNESGGVNGRKVVAEIVDDGYAVNTAVAACHDLAAKKPLFISGTSGADQIVACGQVALEQGIPYLSLGVSESGLIDRPGYRALTMTYDQQGELLARYVVGELEGDTKKLGMVRFNSPNADGAHEHFVQTLNELGARLAVDDAVDKQGNANELTSECLKLQRAGVEIVHVFAAPTVSSGLANACESQGYEPQYVSMSNTFACSVTPPIFGPSLDGCITFSATRLPEEATSPLMKEARDAWARYYADDPVPDSLEMFWGLMDIYRQALKEAGPDLTPRAFLQALDGLDYDNGLFNPISSDGTRVLGHGVVVFRADASIEDFHEIVSEWTSDF